MQLDRGARLRGMRFIAAVLLAGLLLGMAGIPGCVTEHTPGPDGGEPGPRPEILHYVTEEYPPFNYLENGSPKGVAVELLKEITGRTGDPVTDDRIRFLPWPDAYTAALEERNTVLFSTGRLPHRESLFQWVGPICTYQDVLFARRDRDILVRGPEDLEGYRIGVVLDEATIPELLAIGVNANLLVAANDTPALIRMLRDGEIDLLCQSGPAGRYFAERETGDPEYLREVYALEAHDLYYAFNRNTSAGLIAPFREAYRAVVTEKDVTGTSAYERIASRCLPANRTEER
jgi:polar amino acid transport system substrate-binding protein